MRVTDAEQQCYKDYVAEAGLLQQHNKDDQIHTIYSFIHLIICPSNNHHLIFKSSNYQLRITSSELAIQSEKDTP